MGLRGKGAFRFSARKAYFAQNRKFSASGKEFFAVMRLHSLFSVKTNKKYYKIIQKNINYINIIVIVSQIKNGVNVQSIRIVNFFARWFGGIENGFYMGKTGGNA